jgi:preprotein translocase subunit SecA
VLVGTVSVEKSELVARLLRAENIPHHVLNAKNHAREAEIIAQAGRKGAVTISTNMAGRGTDILLGGNPEYLARNAMTMDSAQAFEEGLKRYKEVCAAEHQDVLAVGGLYVIGTERHESRRIDNQLRGRAGRQGDPGRSRFYMSLQDDLLRIFGAERVEKIMNMLNVPEDEPIIHRWISKAIESAQKRVEGHNFDMRKSLLEYDDVMNQQRLTIYQLRRSILEGSTVHDKIMESMEDVVDMLVEQYCPQGVNAEEWAWDEFLESINYVFSPEGNPLEGVARNRDAIFEALSKAMRARYEERETRIFESLSLVRQIERNEDEQTAKKVAEIRWRLYERDQFLRELDRQWKDHLLGMDHLKEGVYLEAYAQKDPKIIYKKEGYNLFQDMIARIKENLMRFLYRVEVRSESEVEALRDHRSRQKQQLQYSSQASQQQAAAAAAPPKPKTVRREVPKTGRNDPCHCGSGKKYKNCCLDKDQPRD